MHAELGTDGRELLTIVADRKANRCTAACLDARAELRAEILGALAQDLGTRTVASAFHVSREVVRALKKQVLDSGELDQVKQRLGRDAYALADATLARISDELDDMPRASLPIVYGVLVDKAQLLTGGPTVRVQREEAPTDINALVDSLPRAEVVELVDAREIPAPKAGAVGLPGPLLDPAGDSESPVSRPVDVGPGADRAADGQTDRKKGAA